MELTVAAVMFLVQGVIPKEILHQFVHDLPNLAAEDVKAAEKAEAEKDAESN